MNAPFTHSIDAHNAAALHVAFVTSLTELQQLRAAWEALNHTLSDHDAPFFQSHAWSEHVARVRLQRSPESYRLAVALVYRAERLIGIWPLALRLNAGAWIAHSLDDPFGQFAGVAFEHSRDIAAGVHAVIAALRAQQVCAGLCIEAVVAGSALHQALRAAGAATNESSEAVFVDLRPYATLEEYRRSVNKKTRKNLRNLRNRLQREHRLSEVVVQDAERLAALIEATYAARLDWMDRFAHTSPAFRDADFRSVVGGLTLASSIGVLGFSLSTEEGYAAAQWGFTYLDRYYAYVSARNPSYEPFSAGRMHLGMVIEACFARGIKLLELMAPASDYKLEWTDRTKRLDNMVLPFTLRGSLVLRFMRGWASPTARRLSHALPGFIRDPLVRRLNRG